MSIITPVAPGTSESSFDTTRHPLLRRRELPVAVALLVVLVGTSISNHRFLSSQGRTDLMLAAAITGMVAIGETFVLLMRKVDLSELFSRFTATSLCFTPVSILYTMSS